MTTELMYPKPSAQDSISEAPFLIDLFKELKREKVNYCILRNHQKLPYSLGGSDLDILLLRSDLVKARGVIVRTAEKNGGFASWRKLNDYNQGYFHCYGISRNGIRWGIHIDLMVGVRWKGLEYFSADNVLSRAEWRQNICVANSFDDIIIALLDKILHMHSEINYLKYIQAAAPLYPNVPDDLRKHLLTNFGPGLACLSQLLETENLNLTKETSRHLRRALLKRKLLTSPIQVFRNKLERIGAHCSRLIRRLGVFVAFVGPDGSGKSTLISLACEDIERLLHQRPECKYHRPALLPRIARLFCKNTKDDDEPTLPHTLPPSGTIGSILRMIYYTIDYFLGYWLLVYPRLVKRGAVIFFDGYFYDYIFDPIRWRIDLPRWIPRGFSLFVPVPDLVVILTGDPQVLHDRKPELSIDEINRQCNLIDDWGRKKAGRIVRIDTSTELAVCRDKIVDAVIELFRDRGE